MTIQEMLAQTAARVPEKLVFAGTRVTYRLLETRARALANGFASHGVKRGDRVVVWLPKSPSYVTAIFAALIAGAGYVPLDSTQPAARVRAILDDCQPAALVTTSMMLRAVEHLPGSIRAVWMVDDGADLSSIEPTVVKSNAALEARLPDVPAEVGLLDLAAILYTSGSTGTPKGVMISHINLTNFITWACAELQLREDDVFSSHASFNFDLSTFDLFGSVAVGASVWLIPDGSARDVAALLGGLERHRISVWYSVPSVLALLLESGQVTRERLARIRYLLFAGEEFPIKQLRQLRELLPRTAGLYNLYGPTETNVCTFYPINRVDPDQDPPV